MQTNVLMEWDRQTIFSPQTTWRIRMSFSMIVKQTLNKWPLVDKKEHERPDLVCCRMPHALNLLAVGVFHHHQCQPNELAADRPSSGKVRHWEYINALHLYNTPAAVTRHLHSIKVPSERHSVVTVSSHPCWSVLVRLLTKINLNFGRFHIFKHQSPTRFRTRNSGVRKDHHLYLLLCHHMLTVALILTSSSYAYLKFF